MTELCDDNCGLVVVVVAAAVVVVVLVVVSSEACRYNKLCRLPPPLQVDDIFAFIRQVAVLFRHNNIFVFIRQAAPVPACWLFRTSAAS